MLKISAGVFTHTVGYTMPSWFPHSLTVYRTNTSAIRSDDGVSMLDIYV